MSTLSAEGFLSLSAFEANRRIGDFCGAKPNLIASNLEVARDMRATLFAILNEEPALSFLRDHILLTAPHSHWRAGDIVIISYDMQQEMWLIGVQPVKPNALYLAVSYVLSPNGPQPYEWATSEITHLSPEITGDFGRLVAAFQEKTGELTFPFGLALNYRTVTGSSEIDDSTIEYNISSDLSVICPISRYAYPHVPRRENFESVAWQAVTAADTASHVLTCEQRAAYQRVIDWISNTTDVFDQRDRMTEAIRTLAASRLMRQ